MPPVDLISTLTRFSLVGENDLGAASSQDSVTLNTDFDFLSPPTTNDRTKSSDSCFSVKKITLLYFSKLKKANALSEAIKPKLTMRFKTPFS